MTVRCYAFLLLLVESGVPCKIRYDRNKTTSQYSKNVTPRFQTDRRNKNEHNDNPERAHLFDASIMNA